MAEFGVSDGWRDCLAENAERYPLPLRPEEVEAARASERPILVTFEFKGWGEVRGTWWQGQPWFVAADLAQVLNLSNIRKRVAGLEVEEKTTINFLVGKDNGTGNYVYSSPVAENKPGGGRDNVIFGDVIRNSAVPLRGRAAMFVNESGLYKLVFRSDTPRAKAFTTWVTSEVLPSIRRTGKYEDRKRAALAFTWGDGQGIARRWNEAGIAAWAKLDPHERAKLKKLHGYPWRCRGSSMASWHAIEEFGPPLEAA